MGWDIWLGCMTMDRNRNKKIAEPSELNEKMMTYTHLHLLCPIIRQVETESGYKSRKSGGVLKIPSNG